MMERKIRWLSPLPAHWIVEPFGWHAALRKERNGTADRPMLSVSGYRGVVNKEYDDERRELTPDEKANYLVVRPDELAVNTMWLNFCGLGVSGMEGVISPAYRVYSLLASVHPRYIHHLLRSDGFVQEYTRLAYGIRPNSLQVSDYDFRRLLIPIPPLDEQRAIADFLDRETARIDELISKYERFVELVDHQATSEMVAVLTGKMHTPSKGASLAWIGEVPTHWDVLPIGRIAQAIETGPFGSQLHAEDYEQSGIPVINPAHLTNGRIAEDENSAVAVATAERLCRHRLAEGDLILARRGEVGRCAVVSQREVGWVCGTGCMKLRLKSGNDPRYFNLLMGTPGPLEQLLLHSVGSTMPNINPTIMSRLLVPVPPTPEQTELVEEVQIIRARAEILSARVEKAIECLREYRSALISAAVTGQIDVRNYKPQEAAAVCP